MSDVQVLFAVLAGLYLWECACWLRRDAVAVATWLGTRWQLLQPGTLGGNQRGGFVLAPPLPPLGSFLAANQLPFTLAPEGVLFFVATNVNPGWRAAHGGQYFRFDEVQEVRADRKRLFVNGRLLLRTTSPGHARQLDDQGFVTHREVLQRFFDLRQTVKDDQVWRARTQFARCLGSAQHQHD